MTAPRPDGSGAAKAMAMAVRPTPVSHRIRWTISTPTAPPLHLNDAGETAAVKLVFGDHARELMMSSTKSMTGHMLGAAGAVEAIFTALALRDGYAPATIHYQVPDEACDLDVVPNEGRERRSALRHVQLSGLRRPQRQHPAEEMGGLTHGTAAQFQ